MSVDIQRATSGQNPGDRASLDRTDHGSLVEQRIEDFAEVAPGYFWEMDSGLRYSYLSDKFSNVTGIPRGMVLGMTDADVGWSSDIDDAWQHFTAALQSRRSFQSADVSFLHPNGQVVALSMSGKALFDPAGRFAGFRGVARESHGDVALDQGDHSSQSAYRIAGRIASVGFWEWDETINRCTYCSEEMARIHGVSVQEYMRRTATAERNRVWIHPDDRKRYEDADSEYRSQCQGFEIEYRVLRDDGEVAILMEVVVPIVDEAHRLVRSFGYVKDITQQKAVAAELERSYEDLDARVRERTIELQGAYDELSKSKAQLREATGIAKLGYFRWNTAANKCIYRDEELSRILGANVADYENESTEDFLGRIHPDELSDVLSAYEHSRTAPEALNIEYRIVRPDGSIRYVNECSTPVLADDGTVIETVGTMQDITERKKVSFQLEMVEERLYELGANAREVLYVLSADWREVIYVSKAFEEVWGRSCESLVADPRMWYEGLHPDDVDMIYAEIGAKMSGEDATPDFSDARIIGKDGTVHWLAARVYPIRDENGTTVRFAGVAEDITERKAATDALHHAQKLEAVGQLTGGVAHDFNNLLAVIMGNAELLRGQVNGSDELLLNDILTAGRRGAEMTKRLLAFSRLQPLRPVSTNVNELLVNMGELLQRTLGATVTVNIIPAESDIFVYVDPGLFENAILNLALNSRDAMLNGGRLQIAVEKSSGEDEECQTVISVKDDGSGMSSDVMTRVLEPYFTTKELGEGSGLGLSMVYGFVKQSDGDLKIASQPDEGTTVTISLPCNETRKRN